MRLLHPLHPPLLSTCTLHPPYPLHPFPAPHQVLRFTGDFTKTGLEAPSLRGRPLPRVVILRKHQLQSEQRGVFCHLAGPAGPAGLAGTAAPPGPAGDEGAHAAVSAGASAGASAGGGEWRARAREQRVVALPAVVSGLTPHASKHVEMEMHKAYAADKGRKVGRSKFGKTDPGALCALATKAPQRLQP